MSNSYRKNRPSGAGLDGRPPSRRSHAGPFLVSHHAATRFLERVPEARGLSHAAARAELVAIARSARRTGELTSRGDQIWEATDGERIRFVVRRDAAHSLLVCTTVLPPADVEIEDNEMLSEAG